MSLKGLYLCRYIANKYFLNISPEDYNQEYKLEISRTLEQMNDIHLFENLSVPENRTDAAFFTVVRLLLVATPTDKEAVYHVFKDSSVLPVLKKYIKAGIFI